MPKIAKTSTSIGCVLLLIMAAFHGSGLFFIGKAIDASNAESFLKDIFPVLFVHPTIQLAFLAAFGFVAMTVGSGARRFLVLVSLAVFADVALAIYLGGLLPAALLTVAALCFAVAAYKSPKGEITQSS